ncbi:MAG TPA: DUF4241 domain-containing protein [Pyrinomonadaceae bacterium]|jgi:hypothetical protein
MKLPDFSKLFDEGKEVATEIGRVSLRVKPAGDLTVTSGRVVACDPLVSPDVEPFDRRVPAGTFPVILSVAHFEDEDRRVAAAMLRFAERAPASWELALRPGEELSALTEGEVFGYPVDSDTGCFMDAEAARLLLSGADEQAFADAIIVEMDETYEDTWSWANVELDAGAGHNVVAFSTGVGDGLYASYFGLDEGGRVVCLVTDFSLFEFEEFD